MCKPGPVGGEGDHPAYTGAQRREGWGYRPDRQASARHARETVQPLHRGGRRPLYDCGAKAPLRRIGPKAAIAIGAAWS